MRFIKDKTTKFIAFVLLATMLALVSCQHQQVPHSPSMGGAGNIPPSNVVSGRFTSDEDKIANFKLGVPNGFWARHDRGNGHPFNCSFSNQHAIIENELLTLMLSKRIAHINAIKRKRQVCRC